MGYFKLGKFLNNVFEKLFADDEDPYFLENVPQFCRQCELLGICRDENNNWKCRQGCMIISPDRKKSRKK